MNERAEGEKALEEVGEDIDDVLGGRLRTGPHCQPVHLESDIDHIIHKIR